MQHLITVLLIYEISFFDKASATKCYNPDGTLQVFDQPAFQPCNQIDGAISMCCGTNWTGGVVGPDICQPNGLCLNSLNDKPLYWRSSCTDPTWKSPLCLRDLCTDPEKGGDPTQNVALTECADGSWCCQGGNTTCCDDGLGLKIAATIGSSSTTSSTSFSTNLATSYTPRSRTTATSTSNEQASDMPAELTSSSSPILTKNSTSIPQSTTPSNATKDMPQSDLTTATKVGIAVGATALGVIAIAGVGIWRNGRKLKEDNRFKAPRYYQDRLEWDRWHKALPVIYEPNREVPVEAEGTANEKKRRVYEIG